MIIYPYRDAIEGIQEIISENTEASSEEKQKLADACRDYLDWLGEDEDDDWEDEDE